MKHFYTKKILKPTRLVAAVLPTLVMLSLVLGSGAMKIQLPAFAAIFISFFMLLFFRFKSGYVCMSVVLGFSFLTAAITLSAVISVLQSVRFSDIILYNFSMYMFIVLFLAARTGTIDYKGYMNAILVFSLTVIFLTFAGLFDVFGGRQLQAKVLTVLSGLDGQKPIAGIIFKGFYLQGTLAIIPACVFFMHQKKWKHFFVCFLALALALSRFGLLTVMLCYCLIYKRHVMRIAFAAGFVFLLGYIFQIPILISLLELFSGNDSGMSIRMGHLKGIVEILEENPVYFFFGQGPGSSFWSYGFKRLTPTVEISQFDFLRKYGIFTTIFFVVSLLFAAFCLIRRTDAVGQGLGYGIIGHFIVALSNPVLLSLPFSGYFAICVAYIVDGRQRRCTSGAGSVYFAEGRQK